MDLIDVYKIAINSKSYDEFKSVIDYHENGNPLTAISSNEFKLITVDLGGVSVSDYFIIEYSDWDETKNSCVVYAKSKDLALADFKKNYGLEVLNIMQAYLR